MKKSVREIENDIKEAKKSFRSYRLDMSFGELMNLYEEDQLIISPSYQRLFRWKDFIKRSGGSVRCYL